MVYDRKEEAARQTKLHIESISKKYNAGSTPVESLPVVEKLGEMKYTPETIKMVLQIYRSMPSEERNNILKNIAKDVLVALEARLESFSGQNVGSKKAILSNGIRSLCDPALHNGQLYNVVENAFTDNAL